MENKEKIKWNNPIIRYLNNPNSIQREEKVIIKGKTYISLHSYVETIKGLWRDVISKDQPLERIPEETKKCKHENVLVVSVSFRDTLENNTGELLYKCKKCGEMTTIKNGVKVEPLQNGERDWKEKLEYFMGYDEAGLYDEAVAYFEDLLSQSKKEELEYLIEEYGEVDTPYLSMLPHEILEERERLESLTNQKKENEN